MSALSTTVILASTIFHRARVHFLLLVLPHCIHLLLPDPRAEPDVGRPPATRRAGRPESHYLRQTSSLRYPNVRTDMVRPDFRHSLRLSFPPPLPFPSTIHILWRHRCSCNHDPFSLTFRIAFEMVALAAARLGHVAFAAQSIIMITDQSQVGFGSLWQRQTPDS